MLRNAPMIPYVPVSDLERARKFYEKTLGFEPKETVGEGVVYECGKGTRMFVYRSAWAGTNKASCAFWEVDDVEAEVADLKARGVVFEEYDLPQLKTVNGIANPGGAGKIAWFKDTEGNIMAVTQGRR